MTELIWWYFILHLLMFVCEYNSLGDALLTDLSGKHGELTPIPGT